MKNLLVALIVWGITVVYCPYEKTGFVYTTRLDFNVMIWVDMTAKVMTCVTDKETWKVSGDKFSAYFGVMWNEFLSSPSAFIIPMPESNNGAEESPKDKL